MQTTLSPDLSAGISLCTSAPLRAGQNRKANQAALVAHQPAMSVLPLAQPDGSDWIYGHDGSLTAQDSTGAWWGGCSLPRRAAEKILATLSVGGRVGCFLFPMHAAQVRVALDLLGPNQALIVLCPDLEAFSVLLACEDFSADLAGRRLWFAAGPDWSSHLARLFDDHPGLPVPSQFIRAIAVDTDPADSLIAPAEQVFNTVSARRAELMKANRQAWLARPADQGPARLCVLAPSLFRLWDDIGYTLGRTLGSTDSTERAIIIDSDSPLSAAPTALSARLNEIDAIIAPHAGRGDLQPVIPDAMPWIAWVVTPHIPLVETAGSRDGLLLADPRWLALAIDAGWTRDRLEIAGWPTHSPRQSAPQPSAQSFIAIVSDLPSMQPSRRIKDFSSHLLLWEAMRSELLADPFSLGNDPLSFVITRQRRMQIADAGFEPRQLVESLVLPTFIEGLALLLDHAGVAIRCFGRGWNSDSGLPASALAGPVTSRDALETVLSSAAALVYPWPNEHLRSLDAAGCRLIRPDAGRETFLTAARAAAPAAAVSDAVATIAPLSRARVLNLLRRLQARA